MILLDQQGPHIKWEQIQFRVHPYIFHERVLTHLKGNHKYSTQKMQREYTGKELEAWQSEADIEHQTTGPYTLEKNGVAEKKNCIIVEMVRYMIMDTE